jgi:hypothetical protein
VPTASSVSADAQSPMAMAYSCLEERRVERLSEVVDERSAEEGDTAPTVSASSSSSKNTMHAIHPSAICMKTGGKGLECMQARKQTQAAARLVLEASEGWVRPFLSRRVGWRSSAAGHRCGKLQPGSCTSAAVNKARVEDVVRAAAGAQLGCLT